MPVKTHCSLWLSVPVGIFITVICLSGAALVFEQEIKQWLNRDIYASEHSEGQERMRPSEIIAAVKTQVPDTLRISGLTVPGREGLSYAVTFEDMHRRPLYVDPYTGEVKGWERNYAFFTAMRQLHRWLLDVPPQKGEKTVGKMVVGISTLVMVFILVTGLVIWFPKTVRMLRQRLSVKTGKSRYRFWYDTHVSLGFYSTARDGVDRADVVVRLVSHGFLLGIRGGAAAATSVNPQFRTGKTEWIRFYCLGQSPFGNRAEICRL